MAAAGASKQPLLATRFCVDTCSGASTAPGRFVVGDLAGELAAVDAASYSVERRVSDCGCWISPCNLHGILCWLIFAGSHAPCGTAGTSKVYHLQATCILHHSPATPQGNKEWEHNTVHGAAGRTGRVLALQPSPFLPDVLLAVSHCGFAVWRVKRRGSSTGSGGAWDGSGGAWGGSGGAEVDSGVEGGMADGSSEALLPIFESRFPHALYSCGCWSPSKPGGSECAAILPQWIGAAVLLVLVEAAAIPRPALLEPCLHYAAVKVLLLL